VTILRIFAFTDFHGNKRAFETAKYAIASQKPDFVVAAGDITNYDAEAAKRFLLNLASAGYPVYFVPGNMDNVALGEWKGTENLHALHGCCEYYQGLALVGLGGSPRGPFGTPFEYDEAYAFRLLEEAMKTYHGGKLVFVPHCPPKDTRLDRVSVGLHAGSTAVRTFVEKNQPLVVISGHIHEAQGTDKIGSSTLVNTGPAQRGSYAEIVLEDKVTVRFLNLF